MEKDLLKKYIVVRDKKIKGVRLKAAPFL